MTLVTLRNRGKGMPMPLAIGHGLMAAAGLVTLVINVAGNTGNMLMNISLALFLPRPLAASPCFHFM